MGSLGLAFAAVAEQHGDVGAAVDIAAVDIPRMRRFGAKHFEAAGTGPAIGIVRRNPEIDVHGSAIGMFIQPVQLLIALV